MHIAVISSTVAIAEKTKADAMKLFDEEMRSNGESCKDFGIQINSIKFAPVFPNFVGKSD